MGVVITGMHRSGTSMLGQWASRTGLDMGEGPLFTTDSANPRGLFERRDVVAFNDRWLSDLGGSWWAPPFITEHTWRTLDAHRLETDREAIDLFRGTDPDWFVKDPRLSLLTPLWDRLCLQRLPIVVGLRRPRAVAMSLHVRNGTTLRKGLALWVAYNRAIFRQAQERNLLILDLDLTLADPGTTADTLLAFFEHAGLRTTNDVDRMVAGLEPRLLRQHSERLQGSAERLAEDLDEMYDALCAAHGTPLNDLDSPMHVPDWAAEALEELSQEWHLRTRLTSLEAQQPDAGTGNRGRAPIWRRFRPLG